MAKRRDWTGQVARCIARLQSDYLLFGGLSAAMTLRDIADETGFHVSTVSRAIKDKYLLCCQGTVSIKSMFSSGLRFGADAVVTPAMICRQIDALIRAENVNSPFSDEELKRELVSSGFVVSRRTIAKYRTSMGIPASPMRMRVS
ncbi:RNA polymerase sigma-54 factor [bioreactor metagenome]|uniref:RNA polymerase sigma-54 factor n=1 Tax=bioreactor metagenome TaxID=1076179 RepID=A0A645I592_9ZZZZ